MALTFLAAVPDSDGGHHCLETTVHGFWFRVESHVGDVARDINDVGHAAAKILLPRVHVRAIPKYVYKVGVALVRSLELKRLEHQLDLKIVTCDSSFFPLQKYRFL